MTSVVSLAEVREARRRMAECIQIGLVIDPNEPLQPGDIVAFRFGKAPEVIFSIWHGPTGRDYHGRFVAKGSPQEAFALDEMVYNTESVRNGKFQVLGSVRFGRIRGEARGPSAA